MSKGFEGSIGGKSGSSSISTNSIKQSSATGGPVAGYKAGGWGAQGSPVPQKGAAICAPGQSVAGKAPPPK
jgi:hypothetical protein